MPVSGVAGEMRAQTTEISFGYPDHSQEQGGLNTGRKSDWASLARRGNMPGIDPMVTGSRVTQAELQAFEERRIRYMSCGDCGQNPYPGD